MPIFWKMLLLYQVRHKLYWHSQVQVHQWTICCSWTHRQGGAAQLGLRHKQHPFICLYRHWVPPDSLAKTDTAACRWWQRRTEYLRQQRWCALPEWHECCPQSLQGSGSKVKGVRKVSSDHGKWWECFQLERASPLLWAATARPRVLATCNVG